MIVELRWVSMSASGPGDVFEHVDMPEAPLVDDLITTDDQSGVVINRMWLLLTTRTAETPILQATVKLV